uniref:Iron permease FTR1 n=2 Tax=Trieres chinensis TaxID=1514140 RepID=A0A7S2A6Q8_TRICV|eukprot:CAMPEP_0183324660 /NCGR_PEP_ID=MMETSP0160_2-20130417/77583_1 /TAXON_ID=2839 ORGANISM="Odontella Sinensis, Strain Grunow 1884" /NCGR_SAMPLE_ID=MMETSP0160_2 /ASSEMBLY_ACC=CAM_ASM_000250 /LENGTH=327 /DNA_ID=CAMNT_0025492281 /DNA_START=90 /DNA_END=1073 /DNA_ORIENTATION=+
MGADSSRLFDFAIMTICAREVLEGAIIVGQYRTVLHKSDNWEGDKLKEGLQCITRSALYATALAVVVILAVAIPLGVTTQNLDEKVADIIEGVSKVVAAICILQLSWKIPKWLGLYKSKKEITGDAVVGLTLRSIRFNVMWNIWREVAEVGVFLIPFFLGGKAIAVPLSALAGCVLSAVLGAGIYVANQRMTRKWILAFFMSALTGMLSVGLFVGGCHEFEEVWGETKKVWKIQNQFWAHKRLPMVILKPFGYSASRTQLQIACFWCWLTLLIVGHVWKWYSAKKITEAAELAKRELEEAKLNKDGDNQQLESSDEEEGNFKSEGQV